MNTDRDENLMGGDKEWGRNIITLPGSYHRERGMKCQDQALYRYRDGKEVLLVADGSGSDDVNVICVERILDLLADYLLDYFNDICRRDNGNCAYAILITVIRVIGEIMENENRKKEDLGSTLMGVCIDKVSNRFCYVHLGNGIIAYGKKDRGSAKHRVGILSRPDDGIGMDQVILTISDCAGQALKLSSGKLKDITGFILMTDGVYAEKWGSLNLENTFEKICKGTIRMSETKDDQCAAAMFRKEQQCSDRKKQIISQ